MSQKTIYPGMPAGNPDQQFGSSNPFFQQSSRQSFSEGTVYPGKPDGPAQDGKRGKTPIMGFLYSVSRTPFGEFWPLFEGPNKIGRNEQNTVTLHENSVSDFHATITIRRMKKSGTSIGVSVYLQDSNSMLGTMLNGETLDYNPRECKSGDIITIGAHYELYLILVDADALGLSPKEDFSSSEEILNSWQPMIDFQNTIPDKGTIGGSGQTGHAKTTLYMKASK